jgi:hypothetical protein
MRGIDRSVPRARSDARARSPGGACKAAVSNSGYGRPTPHATGGAQAAKDRVTLVLVRDSPAADDRDLERAASGADSDVRHPAIMP